MLAITLDVVTFFFAFLTSTFFGIVTLLIFKCESAKMFIKKGNGGKHIRAVAIGCLLSGLTSLPYLMFSLNYQSQICPYKMFHILACLRVFSLRFEASQFLWLSIDRLIISFELNLGKFRRLRHSLFWPSQVICVILAISDVLMFAKRDSAQWPAYSIECTLLSVSNSVFMHWHFFVLNFLTLALTAFLLAIQCIFQPIPATNNYLRKRMIKLSNIWLALFSIGLAILLLLELADRFSVDFNPTKSLRNFDDTIFQLLHLLYFPFFLRSVPWKWPNKVNTLSSINTIQLNTTPK